MENRLYRGPFRPTLEEALAGEVAHAKEGGPLEPVLVLVGSGALAGYLKRTLADRLGGHANVTVITLHNFCERLCGGAVDAVATPRALKAFAAARVAARAEEANYFKSVSALPGLGGVLLAAFDDLDEGGFRPAGGPPGAPDGSDGKTRDVFDLYARFLEETRDWPGDRARLEAEAAARVAAVPGVFGTDTVMLYGFYDLTRLQQRLVEAMGPALHLCFFVPVEDRTGRGDDPAFAYARPFLAWLQELGFGSAESRVSPDRGSIGAVRSRIFLPPADRSGPPPGYDGSIKVISCAGEAAEVREIMREALRLARDEGIPFNEMAILLKRPDTYLPLIRDEFERSGVGVGASAGPPLSTTREGRSLTLLLGLIGSDYPRRQVVEFLTYAPLDLEGLTGHAVSTVRWGELTMLANVVGGRGQWSSRLERFARSPDPSTSALPRAVDALIGGLESLPSSGTIREHSVALSALTVRLLEDSEQRRAVEELLGKLALVAYDETVTLAEFVEVARRVLEESGATTGPAVGSVRVLDIMQSRGLGFRVVFVPGLVEKGFPAAASEDPVLLDSERERLNASGIGTLPLKRARSAEEKLLFMLAAGAASERLVLTFPRLDMSEGRARIPSFFLLRSVECYAGGTADYERLDSEGAPGFVRAPALCGEGVPSIDALDRPEFNLSLVWSEGEAARAHLESSIDSVARGRRLIDGRYRSFGLGEYDGVLGSGEGPGPGAEFADGRVYRATELEEYTRCPFKYFLGRLLGLAPLEEPGELVEIEPRERGSLIHRVLSRFFEECASRGLLPLSRADEAAHRALLLEIAAEEFTGLESFGLSGRPALWEIEREEITDALLRLLEAEYSDLSGFVPTAFEVPFGPSSRDEEDAEAREALSITLECGDRMLFKGRLDRIDVSEDGRSCRVIDYKTGRVSQNPSSPFETKAKSPGFLFQTMIYARAAAQALGREPFDRVVAENYYIAAPERAPVRVAYGGLAFEAHDAELLKILGAANEAIRAGFFAPRPSSRCSEYCDFSCVCPADAGVLSRRKRFDALAQRFTWLFSGRLDGG